MTYKRAILSCLVLFVVLHAYSFFQSMRLQSGYQQVREYIEAGDLASVASQLASLETTCTGDACDILTYTQAHFLFRSHTKIGIGTGGMYPVDALGGIDDMQEETRSGRESSRDLFAEVTQSQDEEIGAWAQHNEEVIGRLLGGQEDSRTEGEEDRGEGEQEDQREELTEEEVQELEEYAEYLDQQQEHYQQDYNSQAKKSSLPKGLQIIDELLGEEYVGEEGVEDW